MREKGMKGRKEGEEKNNPAREVAGLFDRHAPKRKGD